MKHLCGDYVAVSRQFLLVT